MVNGNYGAAEIDILEDLLILHSGHPLFDIVDFSYTRLLQNLTIFKLFEERVIICPTLEVIEMVKDYTVSTILGEEKEYLGFDSYCILGEDVGVGVE